MKVCLDIRVSTKGGTSTFIDNYVRALDEVAHDHDIQYVFNEGATPLNGRHARIAAVPYRNPLLEFQWSQWRLGRIVQRNGFDAYHSLKHVGPMFSGIKTIYRVPAIGQFSGNYPMNKLDHIYWNRVAGHAYRRADLLIAVSDYVADGLRSHLKIADERVVTIHNGVDPLFRRLEQDQIEPERWQQFDLESPYILCVGNLVPVKNFSTAINSYAHLAESDSSLPPLVLAGGQHHEHHLKLRELVANHRLESAVRFIGYQTGHDLLHLYHGAKMLVHPSLHEGFSFTILEAMACGLPIVASSSTSIPEAAGNAAIYYDCPTDAEALSAKMRELLDSEELCRELSRTALERAPEYTWKKCVNKTIKAYDRLH